MTRKTLNIIIFSVISAVIVIAAALTIPKLIADELFPVPPEFMEDVNYCKKRYDITVDNALLLAIAKQESGLRMSMDVVSPAGARGVFQVMPATASGLRSKFGTGDLDKLTENVCHGILYIVGGLANYDGDPHQIQKALAAYNGGPGAGARFDSGNIPAETRHYVDIIYNVYYPAYQQRVSDKAFVAGEKKVSYFEQIMGAVVGGYATDKNLVDKGKEVPKDTPVVQALKVIAKPFYITNVQF